MPSNNLLIASINLDTAEDLYNMRCNEIGNSHNSNNLVKFLYFSTKSSFSLSLKIFLKSPSFNFSLCHIGSQ
ncbi:MAG: hypothetical protein LBQ24_05550 [Candidatus Peribacteria bacterium]|nr:hypothetical protein [Candidatus Peribacteria bacterium]